MGELKWLVAPSPGEGMEVGRGWRAREVLSCVPPGKDGCAWKRLPWALALPFSNFLNFFLSFVVTAAAARLVFQGLEIAKWGQREQSCFCQSLTNQPSAQSQPHIKLSQEFHLLSYNVNAEQLNCPNWIFFRSPSKPRSVMCTWYFHQFQHASKPSRCGICNKHCVLRYFR